MKGRTPERPRGGRRGFTLAELLVAMLASAILALTAGAMLWYGTLGWRRTREAVDLQRDMAATLDVMTRSVRAGTNLVFATGAVFTVRFADRPTARVYANGNDLVYRPNVSDAGNEMTLADGTLRRFAVTVVSNGATVVVVLAGGSEVLSNGVSLVRRN